MLRVVDPKALLINGTVGAGKSSVAEGIGSALASAGVCTVVIDVDCLARLAPSPSEDPFNVELTLKNLAAVSANALAAGAVRLVLAGVIESAAHRRRYEAALGVPLTVCRLDVDLAVVRARIERRHADDPRGRRWHLDRSGELDDILRAAAVENFVVDAGDRAVDSIAGDVLAGAGWLAESRERRV